jgi:Fic family protein
MNTIQKLITEKQGLPESTAWYLNDLAEAKGRQQMYMSQSPRRLKTLREHALIESAVSSNRIEGIQVDPKRVNAVILGRALLKDRDEEEVRGYRDALNLIHQDYAAMDISGATACQLHKLARGQVWDAGQYKQKDGDIIEHLPGGGSRIRFRTIPAVRTAESMNALFNTWQDCERNRALLPLIAIASFHLDFLCVHPFRDGNGRTSRLLLLLQAYQAGFEVGRYVSLERLIEEHKERYYETLEISSDGWHENNHDPWPYINYLLFILKSAYKEFEDRIGATVAPRGEKTEIIHKAVLGQQQPFSIAKLEMLCPGISRDMIRNVLRSMRDDGAVECVGRGPGAQWQRIEKEKG